MNQGYTVTPNVTEDEYGNIVNVDFDLDTPQGFDSRYSNDYYTDHEGRAHHVFEDTELNEDGYDTVDYEEQTVHLLHDLVGGAEAYQQMIAWSAQNLDPEDIEAFDNLIDQCIGSGEYGEVEEAIQRLYQMYIEAGGQNYQPQEYYDEDEEEYDTDYSPIVQTVFDAVGGEDMYNAMLTWGYENLTEEQIDWYDSCMDSDDTDVLSEAVGSLYELFMDSI